MAGELSTSDSQDLRPWLARRDGETDDQYFHRMARTCVKCGVYLVSPIMRMAHQEKCEGPPTIQGVDDTDETSWQLEL